MASTELGPRRKYTPIIQWGWWLTSWSKALRKAKERALENPGEYISYPYHTLTYSNNFSVVGAQYGMRFKASSHVLNVDFHLWESCSLLQNEWSRAVEVSSIRYISHWLTCWYHHQTSNQNRHCVLKITEMTQIWGLRLREVSHTVDYCHVMLT